MEIQLDLFRTKRRVQKREIDRSRQDRTRRTAEQHTKDFVPKRDQRGTKTLTQQSTAANFCRITGRPAQRRPVYRRGDRKCMPYTVQRSSSGNSHSSQKRVTRQEKQCEVAGDAVVRDQLVPLTSPEMVAYKCTYALDSTG